ncbi:hypothetical protein OK349_17345 [Sphingomonas sp. BT-65]|uniref:hypothetical protein n=1 Tax=Sphingomonas sp. BT-65 TaxID=2989821 RepID=UPI00223665C5|nr:hypothetical protein [Sphingomonas sp. BT-65]MCW4463476.1 hypothetical protein [Sphingomonas sp. BT-65]
MQRYAGELTPADNRPAIPMMFDGWEYVPFEVAECAEQKDAERDQSSPDQKGTPVDEMARAEDRSLDR